MDASFKLKELSIIVPVYNEVDNIEALFYEIQTALPADSFVFEALFVDDGSTDLTVSRLQQLAAKEPNLRVLCHKKNYGQSAALCTGARAARYPIIVTMDGDGQNDPKDIPALINEMVNAQTVVLGNRKKRDDHLLRKLSSRIGNRVRRQILKDNCPDTGCSLKVFSREAFLSLPYFNHMHRFLPTLFAHAGLNIINKPVNHRARMHGVSKYGVMNRLFVGIHDLIGVRWLLKRRALIEVIEHA